MVYLMLCAVLLTTLGCAQSQFDRLRDSYQGVFSREIEYSPLLTLNTQDSQHSNHSAPLTQHEVDNAFGIAAASGDIEGIIALATPRKGSFLPSITSRNGSFLPGIKLRKDSFLPSQNGINEAFDLASKHGKKQVVNYLLTPHEGVPLPDQHGINFVFTRPHSIDFMNSLLISRDGVPLPNQKAVNTKFLYSLTVWWSVEVRDYLVTPGKKIPLPNQVGVNNAFSAVIAHYLTRDKDRDLTLSSMRFLLAPNESIPFPGYDKLTEGNSMVNSFPSISDEAREDMLAVLRPYIVVYPVPERREHTVNQGHVHTEQDQGVAFEIHDYAGAYVEVPTKTESGTSASSTKTMLLNDAIMEYVATRVVGKTLPKTESIKKALQTWINANYTARDQRDLAHHAVGKDWNVNTPHTLRKVMVFLQTYHPDKVDIWMRGFVDESINAFSSKPLSCILGIDQRIVTGLRGIDPELDAIFMPPENVLLIKSFIRNKLNINDSANLHVIVSHLWDQGIRSDCNVEVAAPLFATFIKTEITSRGTITDDIRVIIAAVIDDFKIQYDEKVRAQLLIHEDRMLRAQQDREYAASVEIDQRKAEQAIAPKSVNRQIQTKEQQPPQLTRKQLCEKRVAAAEARKLNVPK